MFSGWGRAKNTHPLDTKWAGVLKSKRAGQCSAVWPDFHPVFFFSDYRRPIVLEF